MKPFRIFALALLALGLGSASPASAKVNVVAANQDLQWVTQAVGGGNVSVDYIARTPTPSIPGPARC